MRKRSLVALLLAGALMMQSGAALATDIDIDVGDEEITEEIVIDDGEDTEEVSESTEEETVDRQDPSDIDEDDLEATGTQEITIEDGGETASTVNDSGESQDTYNGIYYEIGDKGITITGVVKDQHYKTDGTLDFEDLDHSQ